ncbi:hypothetical protein C8R45DRAFT_1215021 [Mycena sanguinolenta]|nr:hypothetical protein C8R45DRAFT_1215021 [Mycena sanguinolenta]
MQNLDWAIVVKAASASLTHALPSRATNTLSNQPVLRVRRIPYFATLVRAQLRLKQVCKLRYPDASSSAFTSIISLCGGASSLDACLSLLNTKPTRVHSVSRTRTRRRICTRNPAIPHKFLSGFLACFVKIKTNEGGGTKAEAFSAAFEPGACFAYPYLSRVCTEHHPQYPAELPNDVASIPSPQAEVVALTVVQGTLSHPLLLLPSHPFPPSHPRNLVPLLLIRYLFSRIIASRFQPPGVRCMGFEHSLVARVFAKREQRVPSRASRPRVWGEEP